MAPGQLQVEVDLTNDKVHFVGHTLAQPLRQVEFDYPAPIGDGDGYTGLELLLLSLAGCSGTTLALLLRRQGRTVSALRVSGHGDRRMTHPTCFERIVLDFAVSSPDATDEEIRAAIALAEDSVCPVWAMLRGNVEIEAGFTRLAG